MKYRVFQSSPPKARLVVDGCPCTIRPSFLPCGSRIQIPARAAAIDVSRRVDFHAVRHAGLRPAQVGENPVGLLCQETIGQDLEGPDVAAPRIVDVEHAFVRRERKTVGRDERVGDERHGAEIGRDAVHAGKLQVPLLGDDVVVRIGEEDRAVGLDHDVVGAIEATPLKTVGDHREAAIELAPRDAPCLVLAGEQATLEVAREPVGPVGRLEDHGHALPRRVLDAPVVVDVVEQ